jgi:hypothetical protein
MATNVELVLDKANKFRDRVNDLKAIGEAFRHGDILVRNYNKFLNDVKTLIDAGDESTYTKQDFDDLLDMRNELFQPIMENLSFIEAFERYNPAIPVIVPEIDPLIEELGDKYYDEVNGVYTYHILQKSVNLGNEKYKIMTELNNRCENITALVNKISVFTSITVPEETTTLIKDFYSTTKQEIEGLTVENVLMYNINSTSYQNILNALNALL